MFLRLLKQLRCKNVSKCFREVSDLLPHVSAVADLLALSITIICLQHGFLPLFCLAKPQQSASEVRYFCNSWKTQLMSCPLHSLQYVQLSLKLIGYSVKSNKLVICLYSTLQLGERALKLSGENVESSRKIKHDTCQFSHFQFFIIKSF